MRIVTARCWIVLALVGAAPRPGSAAQVTGAGSTFVYPLLARWATAFARETGVEVNYQSIGSGGGVKQIENGTVDFGATDVPLGDAELAKKRLTQFPLVAGAVVPVVHLSGVGEGVLRLTGAALAGIFLGEITRWNDLRLRALNPGVTLPDRLITVVHRADGSGTTYVFTEYLSAVSPAWRDRVGRATAVTWPAGVGGKGNEGVAAFVKLTEGAIGYVESAVATRAHLTAARLKTAGGAFITPGGPAFRAAVDAVDWSRGFAVSLVNAPGPASWPIAGATYVLLQSGAPDADVRERALRFFGWAFAHGGAMAEDLHYVPLPAPVRDRVMRAWKAAP